MAVAFLSTETSSIDRTIVSCYQTDMGMKINVRYICEESGETGETKVSLTDFHTTNIRDVKYAIQSAIQVPVCEQKLFFQGQLQTHDDLTLSRLYFRDGDYFKVEFSAFADLEGMNRLISELKAIAQEIISAPHEDLIRWLLYNRFYQRLFYVVDKLSGTYFYPWKCSSSVVQRHYFVQEGGFDAFLEVFRFSQKTYPVLKFTECITDHDDVFLELDTFSEEQFSEEHHFLQFNCLSLLWNFSETFPDRKFVLSKNVLPIICDALLLQPHPSDSDDICSIRDVNEMAVGCYGGLVECSPLAQEAASKCTAVIDKLLFMTDRRQHLGPAGYSLFSSIVASNSLFYITFNVKSALPLMEGGVVPKMIDITRSYLTDENGDTSLRYYCCLFLARMRSASLVSLDAETANAIDDLIEIFLEKHQPDEISVIEEDMSYVWITMVPIVHLCFAAGKRSYHDNSPGSDPYLQSTSLPNELSSSDKNESFSNCTTLSCEEAVAEGETTVVFSDNSRWPGSLSTQKLGIFSVQHMLSIEQNRKLLMSENLLPYLGCLLWHLKEVERLKIKASLTKCPNISVPSLKVGAKSVLAYMNGLDVVINR